MSDDLPAKNQEIADRPKPVFLLILDGWGIAEKSEANAISLAKTPNLIRLIKEYPAVILIAGQNSINSRYLTMGYGQAVNEEENLAETCDLSFLLSVANRRQLKIFDSERMAALSYFFNGRREERLIGEDWLAVSAVDDSGSFRVDLLLERIMKESLKAIKGGQYDFIAVACPVLDSIASAGDFVGTIALVEKLDKQVRRLIAEIIDRGGILVIASTHGNAEKLKNLTTDLLDKETTTNPVPLIIAGASFKGRAIGANDAPDGDLSLLEPVGTLADIAPTIAGFLGLQPEQKFVGTDLMAEFR